MSIFYGYLILRWLSMVLRFDARGEGQVADGRLLLDTISVFLYFSRPNHVAA